MAPPGRRAALGFLPDGQDRLGRSERGVTAQGERRGAGVIGRASERDLKAADAGDGGDEAQVDLLGFQNRPLLDVQLEGGRHIRPPCFPQVLDGAADALQPVAQRLAVGVAEVEVLGAERAGPDAAADAGQAVGARLLGKKVHHFEGVAQADAPVAERAGDLQPGEHPGRTIEAAPVRHRVGVRADHDRPQAGLRALHSPEKVATAVDPAAEARLLETPAEKGAAFQEARREGAAGPWPVGLGDGRERHQVAPQAPTVHGQVRPGFRAVRGAHAATLGAGRG